MGARESQIGCLERDAPCDCPSLPCLRAEDPPGRTHARHARCSRVASWWRIYSGLRTDDKPGAYRFERFRPEPAICAALLIARKLSVEPLARIC